MNPNETSPPNILVILADDWGYGDLGCYGNATIQTPCLDRFAEQGTRYSVQIEDYSKALPGYATRPGV